MPGLERGEHGQSNFQVPNKGFVGYNYISLPIPPISEYRRFFVSPEISGIGGPTVPLGRGIGASQYCTSGLGGSTKRSRVARPGIKAYKLDKARLIFHDTVPEYHHDMYNYRRQKITILPYRV